MLQKELSKKKKITRSTLLKDLKTDFVLKRHISGVLSLNLAWIMVWPYCLSFCLPPLSCQFSTVLYNKDKLTINKTMFLSPNVFVFCLGSHSPASNNTLNKACKQRYPLQFTSHTSIFSHHVLYCVLSIDVCRGSVTDSCITYPRASVACLDQVLFWNMIIQEDAEG